MWILTGQHIDVRFAIVGEKTSQLYLVVTFSAPGTCLGDGINYRGPLISLLGTGALLGRYKAVHTALFAGIQLTHGTFEGSI